MKDNNGIHIGTSGWNYKHWKGAFYPEKLPQSKWLSYYSEQFKTVEVNNSFYRLPSEDTFRAWRRTTPEGFIFSVKANRFITHMKKLKEPKEALTNFLGRVRILQERLGPILFQLPPRWGFNLERLTSFLQLLPSDLRYTFEFRDSSWFRNETYETLQANNAAFCIYELSGILSPKEVTSDFIYIRLHGPMKEAYRGQYSIETLSGWAGAFSAWSEQGLEIYCYFDNDEHGYAAEDALRLENMVSETVNRRNGEPAKRRTDKISKD